MLISKNKLWYLWWPPFLIIAVLDKLIEIISSAFKCISVKIPHNRLIIAYLNECMFKVVITSCQIFFAYFWQKKLDSFLRWSYYSNADYYVFTLFVWIQATNSIETLERHYPTQCSVDLAYLRRHLLIQL